LRGGADKYLARQGRIKATATKHWMYSPYSALSSIHFSTRFSNFCKPLEKKFIMFSIQPGHRGSNDTHIGRKMAHFQFFSVQGTGGSPTEPDTENRVVDQDTGSPDMPFSPGLQMPGEPEHFRTYQDRSW